MSQAVTPRVRVEYVAERLCVAPRTVQEMAARGAIPGAARIGKFWTFDRLKFDLFVETRESVWPQNQTSTNEKVSGGSERLSTAGSTERAFARAMSEMLGNGATRGLKNSTARRGSASTAKRGTKR